MAQIDAASPLTPPVQPTRRVPELHRKGKQLVVELGAVFPDRCLKCNAPAEGFKKRFNVSWHHPALYLLVLLGLLIYVIVALVVRKTARLDIPLCPRHRALRRNLMLAGVGCVLLLRQLKKFSHPLV